METLDKVISQQLPTDQSAVTPIWLRKHPPRSNGLPTIPEKEYRCNICRDLEFVDRGDGVFTYCQCRKQRTIERRIKSSQIDPAFADATFENYRTFPHNTKLLDYARQYATEFATLRKERNNGLGFLAKLGESTIKEIKDPIQRAEVKKNHNSYGLGKTHLLTAMALQLLHEGVQVLLVNDADIVAELRQGQFAKDHEHFEKIISSIQGVELLIWDDLGKAKTTEWVLNIYYRIINHRYRKGLPTCFTSNEDMDSLADKIGDATASRLYLMCRNRLLLCEGPDYRLTEP